MEWLRQAKLTDEQRKKNVFDTDEKNLERDVELEQEAIDIYTEHIKITKREHIKKLLDKIIEDEKNHKKFLLKQLEDLDKPMSDKEISEI